jgi:hypothetical protein
MRGGGGVVPNSVAKDAKWRIEKETSSKQSSHPRSLDFD